MFPITEEYIEREYTVAVNYLMLTSEHTVKTIEQKAGKIIFSGSILALIICREKNIK